MSQLKQPFNKSAKDYLKEYWGVAAIGLGTLALAAELLVMPHVMSGGLKQKLDDAIKANNGEKVEEVLKSRYARGMWSGAWEDKWQNEKRKFLGERLCEATQQHSNAAIDAILKNDPEPYRHIIRHGGNFVPFIQGDYVHAYDSLRDCSFGQAIANGDVKAVETYVAHNMVAQGHNELAAIGQSKAMIEYFLQHPDKMAFDRNGNHGNRTQYLLLSHMISSGVPIENLNFALERVNMQEPNDNYSRSYPTMPLRASLAMAGSEHRKNRSYGLAALDALLNKGVNPNAVISDDDNRAFYEQRSSVFSEQSALVFSLRKGSPDSTKRLLAAGADADAALQEIIKNNADPYRMQGWDEAVKTAASGKTRELMAVADQQRDMLEKLKKAPAPR